ncbi:LacI family DNA-binding transcriptional regulator [Arthrobacter sp. GMC3]|uniref:LacI family DNA-binding transcriptional regulator n=1 Tax=Arthrobacter sp. GMC3 TaxID=2058894 RepID=UPI000CE4EC83|nr:LacI family DNA-binding transcriptional regulator [Arthrobacter sp. GMC3]
MSDVAERAGVSVMTVSNVINRPDIVADQTRDKVLASMRALSYRNNLVARSLRLAQPRQIGYILPSEDTAGNLYMDKFLHELASACQAEGRNLTLIAEPTHEAQLKACQDLFYGQSAAGFVIANIKPQDQRPVLLTEYGIPFAAYGQTAAGNEVPWNWVDADSAQGVELAVEHLIEIGHTELAFVGHLPDTVEGDARLRGYLAACRRRGLEHSIQPSRVVSAPNDLEDGLNATLTLLRSPHPPTAIVCLSDLLAAGALLAVRDLGMQPGAQIGITGFDDTPLTSFGSVRITSVKQPSREIARELVRSILEPSDSPQHVLLEPELSIGSSTQR